MNIVKRTLAAAAIVAVSIGAAWAHHNSMDGYDANAPVVLKGEITKIDWSGEHAIVFIKTADGKSWKVQTAPVKTMRENGLDETSFMAKDAVTIRGYQSTDKACKPDCSATAADVTFASGVKVKLDGTHAKETGKQVHDQLVAARGAGEHAHH